MDIRELQYLIAIEEAGSISKAAEKLYMAQASLSQFLKQYESDIGGAVFERTNRGVRPTPAGRDLLLKAHEIINIYHNAENRFHDTENRICGTVKFSCSTFHGQYLVPRALKHFYEEYPDVHVDITEANSLRQEHLLRNNELDLALAGLPFISAERSAAKAIFRDEIVVVCTKTHPLMQDVQSNNEGIAYVRVEDAAKHEFIIADATTLLGHIARTQWKSSGIVLQGRNNKLTAPFATAIAREGLGLALTYRACEIQDDNVAYLRLGEEGLFMELGLLFPNTDYRSRATEAFAGILCKTLREVLTEVVSGHA